MQRKRIPVQATTPPKRKEPSGLQQIGQILYRHRYLIFILVLVVTGGMAAVFMRQNVNKVNTTPNVSDDHHSEAMPSLSTSSITGHLKNSQGKPICEGFKLDAGDLRHAGTLILGEIHDNHNLSLHCLEELTEDNKYHQVLLENVPNGQIVPCARENVKNKPNRLCMGWDNKDVIESENKIKTYNLLLNFLADGKEHYYELISTQATTKTRVQIDKEFTKYLENKLNEANDHFARAYPRDVKTQLSLSIKAMDPAALNDFSSYSSKFYFDVAYKNALEQILQQRKAGHPYEAIFKNINRIPMNDDRVLMRTYKNITTRNNGLLSQLLKDTGLFKIALVGRAHITKVGLKESDANVEYLRSELEKNKDRNPYAILLMDDELAKQAKP